MPMKTRCLLCTQRLDDHQTFRQYLFGDALCMHCRRSLKIKRRTIQLKSLKITSFYEYDDFFSDCLIQYKECMDEALKELFLSKVKDWIHLHYRNCVFLCAPSSQKALTRRGFHPVKQLFEQCGIPIADCFEKTSDITQKKESREKRREIIQHLILHRERIPSGKKLVLIDDAATTGSTLLAMQQLIGKDQVKEAICIAVHPQLLLDFDKTCRRLRIY